MMRLRCTENGLSPEELWNYTTARCRLKHTMSSKTKIKAPSSDANSADIYKVVGLKMTEKLTELFHCMYTKEAIHKCFVVHLY